MIYCMVPNRCRHPTILRLSVEVINKFLEIPMLTEVAPGAGKTLVTAVLSLIEQYGRTIEVQ